MNLVLSTFSPSHLLGERGLRGEWEKIFCAKPAQFEKFSVLSKRVFAPDYLYIAFS